jgi:hypothetical protein
MTTNGNPDPGDKLRNLVAALDDERPSDEEAREVVASLGVDIPGLAARIRARAAAVAGSPARLSKAAELAGLSAAELGVRCDLDEGLVAKLDGRLVELATIPVALLTRLAEALGRGVDEIRAMLDGPPVGFVGARGDASSAFGGAGYPQGEVSAPAVEDFEEAVRCSRLPEEVKRRWLNATGG